MFKKIIFLLLICLLLFNMIGCSSYYKNNPASKSNIGTSFEFICDAGNFDLIYDTKTFIVYVYDNNKYRGGVSAYLSANGKPTKYIDGDIVEIE